MDRSISILGSTGSIGRQALDVVRAGGWRVAALTAAGNIELLEEQIREFRPALAAVADEKKAETLRIRVADTATRVLGGAAAVCEAAAAPEASLVLNAVVGIAGLRPTLSAIQAGKTIALANKETLVAGGDLVMARAAEKGVEILPVDSEHSAIFQCLQGSPRKALRKILLTASGGPFFGMKREDLARVRPADALRHPNWAMGAKITIDSATMMNKGLEVIEACHLFGVGPEDIEIVVHRESIVHSAVEFADGAVIAQLGAPDMRLPIQYAMTYPERLPCPGRRLSLVEIGKLTFFPPDCDTFTCLSACLAAAGAGQRGGGGPLFAGENLLPANRGAGGCGGRKAAGSACRVFGRYFGGRQGGPGLCPGACGLRGYALRRKAGVRRGRAQYSIETGDGL